MATMASSFELLLDRITASSATGNVFQVPRSNISREFQAKVSGTGAVTATVLIEVGNDGVNFHTLYTLTLNGTNSAADGASDQGQWRFIRASASGITGTGASLTVSMVV